MTIFWAFWRKKSWNPEDGSGKCVLYETVFCHPLCERLRVGPQNMRLNSLVCLALQYTFKTVLKQTNFLKNEFRHFTAIGFWVTSFNNQIVFETGNFARFGNKRDYLSTSNNPQNCKNQNVKTLWMNFQLRRLYKDFTSKNVEAVRIAFLIPVCSIFSLKFVFYRWAFLFKYFFCVEYFLELLFLKVRPF